MDVIHYQVGTLVVDLVDADSGRLVWRGTATDTIVHSQEKKAKKIRKAAVKLFKKFPPGSTE